MVYCRGKIALAITAGVIAAMLTAGCASRIFSGSQQFSSATIRAPDAAATQPPLEKYIKHVVIIVQENRSFDNLFAGFPGADTALSGPMHTGARVRLHGTTLQGLDIYHNWVNAMTSWNSGKMNGFDLDSLTNGKPAGTYPYAYVNRDLVAPYWTMASQYVLADHMFPTMFGPSFTAHLDLIAGTTDLSPSEAEADGPNAQPWGCDAPPGTDTSIIGPRRVEFGGAGPFPCFTQFRTLADTLDAAHVTWKYYAPPVIAGSTGEIWSEFDAIRSVRYGADWSRSVVSPETKVLTDASRGTVPDVAWVIPDANDSDHVSQGPGPADGPSWVTSVVNAIGTGPNWKHTAIVIVWDDWGGWYDSVSPPQLDFRGLGIRVGCIIVSPYAKAHYVSHTTYEFGSILKLVEQVFGLPPLGTRADGYTDTRAHSMLDSFDFRQPPRAFKHIPAPLQGSYFLTRPSSLRPPDDE
jgi:phospholipase C